MDFRCQESTFNLQHNNSYVKEKFFVYHGTESTYSRIIFQAMYISRIYIYIARIYTKIRKELEKFNLYQSISKFHGDLHKEKKLKLLQAWIVLLI